MLLNPDDTHNIWIYCDDPVLKVLQRRTWPACSSQDHGGKNDLTGFPPLPFSDPLLPSPCPFICASSLALI